MSTTEEQSLRTFWDLLQRARAWEERIDIDAGPEAARVLPGSALAEDDALTMPYHISHCAWNALITAVDHTRCLRWALNGEEHNGQVQFRQGTHALATLLRCAVENGARAVWLLMPDARSTRVARRIALERHEYDQAKYQWKLIGRNPDDEEAYRRQLQDLVRAACPLAEDVKAAAGFPRYNRLVKEAGGKAALTVWNACSSLAHGDSRSANLLTHQAVDASDGVSARRLTGLSAHRLSLFATQAVALIDRGFTRYQQLAGTAPPRQQRMCRRRKRRRALGGGNPPPTTPRRARPAPPHRSPSRWSGQRAWTRADSAHDRNGFRQAPARTPGTATEGPQPEN